MQNKGSSLPTMASFNTQFRPTSTSVVGQRVPRLTPNPSSTSTSYRSDTQKRTPYNPPQRSPITTTTVNPKEISVPKKQFPNFPILSHGETIAQYINTVPIIAVDSPTGTGKTLYITWKIASQGKRVRVAIPTTVAVRSAYNFQKNYANFTVGYAAGREVQYDQRTQLVYATTGHFVQKILSLIKANRIQQAKDTLGDVFFLDEVHSATVDITMMLGLIVYLYPGEYAGPKLVFATATFNQGDILKFFPAFPIYKIELPSFPVEIEYSPLIDDPLKADISDTVIKIIQKEYQQWQTSVSSVGKKPQSTTSVWHGIVFRPGVAEIQSLIDELESAFPSSFPIDFYPVHSGMNSADVDEIFKDTNRMKIIVGTNMIESSITVPHVGFVIDDLLSKEAGISRQGGQQLTLTLISQAASDQRKGRAGRTMPGRCYRLISEDKWNQLPPHRSPEIDRIPIYETVLRILDAGLSPSELLKIPISRYHQARDVLLKYGMLVQNGDRYEATSVGEFVSNLGLNIHNGYMVYQAYQDFILYAETTHAQLTLRTMIAVACFIENYGVGYFYIPRKTRDESYGDYLQRKEVHQEKYHEIFRGHTDVHTFVNIFWSMITFMNISRSYDTALLLKNRHYLLDFSNQNSLNHRKMREVFSAINDVEQRVLAGVGNPGINFYNNIPSIEDRTRYANLSVRIFRQVYSHNLLVKGEKNNYNNPLTGDKYILSKSSFNTFVDMNPLQVIAAETTEIVGGRGKYNMASILVDVPADV